MKTKKPYFAPRANVLTTTPVSIWQISSWQTTQLDIAIAEATEKGQIERRTIATRLRMKKTRRGFSGETTLYVRNVRQEELDIIAKAREHGINTETPFSFKLTTLGDATQNTEEAFAPMGFLNSGESLDRSFSNMGWKEKEKTMETVIGIIGKMHCAGIEHGNWTFKNVFVDAHREFVIGDFALAMQRQVDFNSAESVFVGFIRDYSSIIRRTKPRIRNFEFWRGILQWLTLGYPSPAEVRKKLDEKIEAELEYYWRTLDGSNKTYNSFC